ncbi:unnamed protein product [Pieris macdunnoughi]|uniref:SWIM-type domain-containing protein n=1 Tax=Pieris macdunnoughi TaxID=345717 RepID=A0A821XUX8_9NEOP|nr:unnamed protein product [Pieris macdunnoughi]
MKHYDAILSYVCGLRSSPTTPQAPRTPGHDRQFSRVRALAFIGCVLVSIFFAMANENLAGPSSCAPLLSTSSESDEDEYKITEHTKKRRRQNKVWVFERKFITVRSAEEFIKNEKTWSIQKIHTTEEGVKRYYRCNKVKLRAEIQCSAAIYLLFDASCDDILLFRTETCHDHENSDCQSTRGINEATKKEIEKLFELRLKPKSIMKNLSKINGLVLPTKLQLNNYLKIIQNSEIPDDGHEVFVLAYEISEDDLDQNFRFMLTTKYLIGLSRQCSVLHADATYKLIWQGFPVLVIGTTDRDKHFHPFGLAVTTAERTEDFIFLFSALKKAVFSIFSYTLSCKVLVCDAAKAIQTAFACTFGTDTVIRMCWAHAKKKMQTRVEQSVQKKSQKEILQDIDALQCASTQEIFDRASEKFLDKWKAEKDFVTYFENEWLILNRFWYLGASLGTPATNNALESFNKTIKDGGTLRERHPLARFLVIASDIVKDWSNEYVINNTERRFAQLPTVSLKMWTESYQWAKLSKQVPLKNSTELVCSYRIPAGSDLDCKNYEKPWETFDEYKEQHFREWEVIMPREKENWLHGTCNCPKFLKDYICKHLVGLAIRLKHVQPPSEARAIPIGMKRKRGRPAKAKKALIVQ